MSSCTNTTAKSSTCAVANAPIPDRLQQQHRNADPMGGMMPGDAPKPPGRGRGHGASFALFFPPR